MNIECPVAVLVTRRGSTPVEEAQLMGIIDGRNGSGGGHADPTVTSVLFEQEGKAWRVLSDVPHNETQVREMYFGKMPDLGYRVIESQIDFPDWLLLDEQDRVVRAEVEHRSSAFVDHAHDPTACDLVVCWEHDWKNPCVPVLELFSGRLYPAERSPGESPTPAAATKKARVLAVEDAVNALMRKGSSYEDATAKVATEMGLKVKAVYWYAGKAKRMRARGW